MNKKDIYSIKPIAYIKTDFDAKFGIPRQSGRAPDAMGEIIFEPEFRNPDAIRGIEEFSHLWIIFGFSEAAENDDAVRMTVRPPRLGGNERRGVFATRSPYRPNHLGMSCVKLCRVEQRGDKGAALVVSGVDILSGSPVYDIKPYIPYADSVSNAKGGFSDEHQNDRLDVIFPEELYGIFPEDKQKVLIECLRDDPRPSYNDDPSRVYKMQFAGFDVAFCVSGKTLRVTEIK